MNRSGGVLDDRELAGELAGRIETSEMEVGSRAWNVALTRLAHAGACAAIATRAEQVGAGDRGVLEWRLSLVRASGLDRYGDRPGGEDAHVLGEGLKEWMPVRNILLADQPAETYTRMVGSAMVCVLSQRALGDLFVIAGVYAGGADRQTDFALRMLAGGAFNNPAVAWELAGLVDTTGPEDEA